MSDELPLAGYSSVSREAPRGGTRTRRTAVHGRNSTRYPYTLMIPQSRTEAILADRLGELGGHVHRPYTLVDVRQDHAGAEVTVSGDGGGSYGQSFVLADVQQLLGSRGPMSEAARVEEVLWRSRFRVHHRIADAFRAGRVLLAGEAAHVHSPAGGQGMNTGIQDAVALRQALTAVVAWGAAESTLDSYERTRRPVAQRVVVLADRLTRVATVKRRRRRSLRNAAPRALDRLQAFRRGLAMEPAELDYR